MALKKTPPKKPSKTPDESENTEETETSEDGEESDSDREAAENRRINAIVTSRVKRELKPLTAMLTTMQESLNKLSKPSEEEETGESGEGEGAETPAGEKPAKRAPARGEADPVVSRKLTKLERELADERAARKRAEEERTQELERGKKSEMRSVFSAILTELGVTDRHLLRSALGILEEDGIMVRDEDGKVKFKGTDKYGIETMYDPKIGLKTWIAGDGKSFVPAIDVGGSGTGPTSRNGGSGQSLTNKEIKGMSPKELAAINLERACEGLPPLGGE